jgi:hypothetical protein
MALVSSSAIINSPTIGTKERGSPSPLSLSERNPDINHSVINDIGLPNAIGFLPIRSKNTSRARPHEGNHELETPSWSVAVSHRTALGASDNPKVMTVIHIKNAAFMGRYSVQGKALTPKNA